MFLAFDGGATISCALVGDEQDAEYVEVGGRRRAFDGTMHSRVRARKRTWRFRTTPLTISAFDTLYTSLTAAGPVDFEGVALDGVGTTVSCHVEIARHSARRYAAATADGGQHRVLEFVLHEE